MASGSVSDHGYDNNAFLSARTWLFHCTVVSREVLPAVLTDEKSVLDDLTVFLWHMFAVEDIHAVPSGWPSIGMPRVRVMQASR